MIRNARNVHPPGASLGSKREHAPLPTRARSSRGAGEGTGRAWVARSESLDSATGAWDISLRLPRDFLTGSELFDAFLLDGTEVNAGPDGLEDCQALVHSWRFAGCKQNCGCEKPCSAVPLRTMNECLSGSQLQHCFAQSLGGRRAAIEDGKADVSWCASDFYWLNEFGGEIDIVVEWFLEFGG